MSSPIRAVVVVAVAVMAAPVASFSQSPTRAQVQAELVQLEQAGYHPGDGDHTTYPAKIQAAEARVADQNSTAQAAAGVGGVVGGSMASGAPATARLTASDGMKPIYFGH